MKFNTIRTRMMLSFFAIALLGFVVVLLSVSKIVEDYLVNQRVSEVQGKMSIWCDELSGSYLSKNGEQLYRSTSQIVKKNKGHLLIVDNQGVVQADIETGSVHSMLAKRMNRPEIARVLWGGEPNSFGIIKNRTQIEQSTSILKSIFPKEEWILYNVYGLFDENDVKVGALFYSTSISDVMNRVSEIRTQATVVMGSVLVIMMIATFFLARSLTEPIVALTRVIRRMSRGEFNLRTTVKGTGELAELGQTFNDMSERLENTEKFRNEFVSNASHELKTPLATMKILIESLIYQDEFDVNMARDFLGDINSEIDRLNGVITDLLRLVQVDKRESSLKKEKVDIAEICNDVIKRLQPISADRNITIHTNLDSVIAEVDRIKIDQVVLNLTENAIKYSEDGKDIELSCSEKAGEAMIAVKDNGIGIPEKDQSHIFDRFYRVDKARSRQTGGTGLGLSIVEGIVKLHGGRIDFESTYGEGSQFTVYLPLK